MEVPVGITGKNYIEWDTFSYSKNFIWETDGVDYEESDSDETIYYRDAIARINVNGVVPLELKKLVRNDLKHKVFQYW